MDFKNMTCNHVTCVIIAVVTFVRRHFSNGRRCGYIRHNALQSVIWPDVNSNLFHNYTLLYLVSYTSM